MKVCPYWIIHPGCSCCIPFPCKIMWGHKKKKEMCLQVFFQHWKSAKALVTGWKKHQQDEQWTQQLFFTILLQAPEALSTGTGGTRGERIVCCTGGDEVGRIICWQVKRQQGLWTLCFSKKCFSPWRDRVLWDNYKAVKGWASPISPCQCSEAPQPDMWSNSSLKASSILVSLQWLRSCRHSLCLYSSQCFSASYVLFLPNALGHLCKITLIVCDYEGP